MSSPLPSTAFYADPAGLGSLKVAAKAESPEALREAARQFESLFTQMMLKSMREASFGDSMTSSETTDFYQEMHDTQLALELSKGKGLGLAEMLVQQLTRAGLVSGTGDTGQGIGDSGQRIADSVQTAGGGWRTSIAGASALSADHQSLSASSWPPASREDFVRQLKPHAEAAGKALGVDPDTLIAHAALETGWGKNMPNGVAGPSFNLFGIKATGQWRGPTVGVSTLEYDAGIAARRVERFRAYASPADCFNDYTSLLGGLDRYAAARGCGGDVQAFAQALQDGGYATDPAYATKLTAVAASLKALLKNDSGAPLTSAQGER